MSKLLVALAQGLGERLQLRLALLNVDAAEAAIYYFVAPLRR